MENNIRQSKALKYGFVAVAIVLGIAVAGTINFINAQDTDQLLKLPSMTVPEWYLGKKVSIDEAKQNAKFDMKVPRALPQSTMLKNVFLSEDGNRALILYSNPSMKAINGPGNALPIPAQIVVEMGVMETNPIPGLKQPIPPIRVFVQEGDQPASEVAQIPQDPDFTFLTINDMEGVGREAKVSGGIYQPASVAWWANNTYYIISADMPLQALVRIAESMV